MLLTIAVSSSALALPHTPHLQLSGSPTQLYAVSTRFAGDVDGDGQRDVLVYAQENFSSSPGVVDVRSGADGSVLMSIAQLGNNPLRSLPMGDAGDVNADGHDDVIVGDSAHNRARVYSGLDGSVLFEFDGTFAQDEFGGSVAGVGDVDGDGRPDVMVGTTAGSKGYAIVYSGADGAVLHAFRGKDAGDLFGSSLAAIGDVDGDGHVDLAVGAPGAGHDYLNPGFPPFVPPFWTDDDAGEVTVFSGLDGHELYSILGRHELDGFGYSLAAAGDVDGDGFDDFVAGSTSTESSSAPGYARVVSGRTGLPLFTFLGDPSVRYIMLSVAGAGDVNGDGVPDILVGGHPYDSFAADALIFSGQNGQPLFRFRASDVPPLGRVTVDGGKDVDGDSIPDFLIGVEQLANGTGYATLFLSGP